jgi:hypothetical protein
MASMELTAGSRWKSAVCDAEVVIVRAPDNPATLACGGAAMVALGSEFESVAGDPALADGIQLGKRYSDEASGIEVLCTKAGSGTLTLDGRTLVIKGPKPLPSSD